MQIETSKKNYSEFWKPDLIALIFATFISFVIFYNKTLDIWAARFFYHPENPGTPWFEAKYFLWNLLYHSANWIGGALLFGCIALLILAQMKPNLKKYRIYALYLFLVMSLGSGLLVNTILKPYWGRPRPREVLELGGRREYRPFYSNGFGLPGKSFPCGHCTVCFTYGVFWWIFRRKNKWLRYTSLITSIIVGSLMGMARMADGGHFFSDVVWAAFIVWYTGFFLYYFVLKIPEYEDNPHSEIKLIKMMNQILDGRKVLVFSIFGFLIMSTLAMLLLASPYYKELNLILSNENVAQYKLEIDKSELEFKVDSHQIESIRINGTIKGFGFPTSETKLDCSKIHEVEHCSIKRIGFFSDYESNIKISVNPKLVTSFKLILFTGNIFLINKNEIPKTYSINSGH